MTCHHKKKFSHKQCFYYNKSDFIYNTISTNTVGDINFDNYQQYVKIYDESFTTKKGVITYSANAYTDTSIEVTNENTYSTIILPGGSINFLLNAKVSGRLFAEKRNVYKIISGTKEYINIKGFVTINILDNGIRKVKIYYNK